jgi:hypothetical protein
MKQREVVETQYIKLPRQVRKFELKVTHSCIKEMQNIK